MKFSFFNIKPSCVVAVIVVVDGVLEVVVVYIVFVDAVVGDIVFKDVFVVVEA
jgi:hypothetical protein